MTTTATIIEQLDEFLTAIDTGLAESGLPVTSRPFQAAVLIVQQNVVEVRTGQGIEQFEPDT